MASTPGTTFTASKKGEKAIRILFTLVKKEDVLDEEGKQIGKKKPLKGYTIKNVFDLSYIEGKELDVFRFDKGKAVENKEAILRALWTTANQNGFHFGCATKEELGEDCYGLCNHKTKEIRILEVMGDLQEISTTVHELGHALAHSAYREDFEGMTPAEKREIKEVEAESIACVVTSFLGLDTTRLNLSYIFGWVDGDINKFRKNLGVIQKHSRTIIEGIEDEMDLERKHKESENTSPSPGICQSPLPISRLNQHERATAREEGRGSQKSQIRHGGDYPHFQRKSQGRSQ